MNSNIEPINIFDFDGTLTTETCPKFLVWIKKYGGKAVFVNQPNKDDEFYEHNNKIYQALNADGMVDLARIADYRNGSMLSNILLRQKGKSPQEDFSR